MKTDREAAIERLLRAGSSPRVPQDGDRCLDAQTLAAWMDGALRGDERRAAEAHAAECVRCQALLATMVKVQPVAPPQSWWRVHAFTWMAPLVAAGAAAIVWAVVPARHAASKTDLAASVRAKNEAPVPRSEVPSPAASPEPAANPGAARQMAAARPPRLTDAPRKEFKSADERRDADTAAEEQQKHSTAGGVGGRLALVEGDAAKTQPGAPAPSRPAEPANAAPLTAPQAPMVATSLDRLGAARAAAPAREAIIVSPIGNARWRIVAGGAVQHSVDGGATWATEQTGATVTLTAGSAPSGSVCWMVGPNGTVVVSTDGVSWRRVAAPDAVDLVAVTATDDKAAIVTSATGRRYETTDGGQTWSRQRE